MKIMLFARPTCVVAFGLPNVKTTIYSHFYVISLDADKRNYERANNNDAGYDGNF